MSQQYPAIPLITHDPYFSYWLMGDELHADWARHWTGSPGGMSGILRIDGKSYRFMGAEPSHLPVLPQTSVEVTATATRFAFYQDEVNIVVEFLSPLLLDDIDLCSRPATYVSFQVSSVEAKTIQIYFDAPAEISVDNTRQDVVWNRFHLPGLDVIRVGSAEQRMLGRSGDDLRIEWGHLYLTAQSDLASTSLCGSEEARTRFEASGDVNPRDDMRMPRRAEDEWPSLVCVFDLGVTRGTENRHLTLAYDDLYSLEFLHRRMQPYWRYSGRDAGDLLEECEQTYASVRSRCLAFDDALSKALNEHGGDAFERLGLICYRQSIAAHKIVADSDGRVMMFSKENFSNGCAATVDVTYPSSPLFLLFNPDLLAAQVLPVLEYAHSDRWKFEYAPHDVGTYPLANGQVYGGGERSHRDQMPVEECGNMLILLGALSHFGGDTSLAEQFWPLLKQWADYLAAKGDAPERQLCTDDFTVRIANNANLAIKAVMGIGAYAQLCEQTGKFEEASRYRLTAEAMAEDWRVRATEGDHTLLAFGVPNTWSLKYNLVWDRLLDLNLFPIELAKKELDFYKLRQETYGLPLDNRMNFAKIDWSLWVASFAGSKEEFSEFVIPIDRWLRETPTRVPVTDLYWTDDGRQVGWDKTRVGQGTAKGFQARSVVGGIFLPLLFPHKQLE